jgi:hypothetical protein
MSNAGTNPSRAAERRLACAKGGRARHARNDPARRRAARLIRVMAPNQGWRNEWSAARAIHARLSNFVRARRLSLTCEENFARTIVSWIRKHDDCQRAFAAKRMPRS